MPSAMVSEDTSKALSHVVIQDIAFSAALLVQPICITAVVDSLMMRASHGALRWFLRPCGPTMKTIDVGRYRYHCIMHLFEQMYFSCYLHLHKSRGRTSSERTFSLAPAVTTIRMHDVCLHYRVCKLQYDQPLASKPVSPGFRAT